MKKLKQIMLVSSNFETFGKRLWRMVEDNAEEPVKIDRKKSKFKHFDTLEDIIEYYELKNVKVLNKSNDVNNVLWFFDGKDIDSEFWLADIEGEDYKKNEIKKIIHTVFPQDQDNIRIIYNNSNYVDLWSNLKNEILSEIINPSS